MDYADTRPYQMEILGLAVWNEFLLCWSWKYSDLCVHWTDKHWGELQRKIPLHRTKMSHGGDYIISGWRSSEHLVYLIIFLILIMLSCKLSFMSFLPLTQVSGWFFQYFHLYGNVLVSFIAILAFTLVILKFDSINFYVFADPWCV